jgi:N-methylhydantoinase A
MAARTDYRIGIDIGGTFTDLALLGPGGKLTTRKVSSTPDDYGRGIADGVLELLAELDLEPADLTGLVHASTIATNAILEHKGATTALITTEGFRDVLEMRRLRIPVLYDLQYDKPSPLVPRHLRFEVTGRMGPRGEIRTPLDMDSVAAAAEEVAASGVQALAIMLLHSHANAEHERAVGEALRRRLGDAVFVTCSTDILPEIREYERTSTTVVNAYVGPVVRHYLRRLEQRLGDLGIVAPLTVMQSNGGVMSAEAAIRKPAYIVESGPAAGVIACAHLARRLGRDNLISFDMGGTTAKAAMIENGEAARTTEYEVGAGINLSSKLVKGGGYPIKLPFIDVSEIGAGGGSIVEIDSSGALKVGPQSAGAMPGPICYGLGGTRPTFTDAMVTLGYLNPVAIAGGRVKLNAQAARDAIMVQVAQPLGLSLEDAAHGIYTLAAATMTRAVKAVTTYRGRDPRDFGLVAFGGNGPIAAVEIARALEIGDVLIPPAPGVFSALGLLVSAPEHSVIRTFVRNIGELTLAEIDSAFEMLEAEIAASFAADGYDAKQVAVTRNAELRYVGQAYELPVLVKPGAVDLAAMQTAFHAEHAQTYGHSSPGDPVDLISVKVTGRLIMEDGGGEFDQFALDAKEIAATSRRCYFGRETGWRETPVFGRAALAGNPRIGPAIVEEYDSTTIVPPGCRVALDTLGNIAIEVTA